MTRRNRALPCGVIGKGEMGEDVVSLQARECGEKAAARLCEAVDANELERATIAKIEAKIRHGYKFIDIIIRKDGVETRYEADWLARLLRLPAPPSSKG